VVGNRTRCRIWDFHRAGVGGQTCGAKGGLNAKSCAGEKSRDCSQKKYVARGKKRGRGNGVNPNKRAKAAPKPDGRE